MKYDTRALTFDITHFEKQNVSYVKYFTCTLLKKAGMYHLNASLHSAYHVTPTKIQTNFQNIFS